MFLVVQSSVARVLRSVQFAVIENSLCNEIVGPEKKRLMKDLQNRVKGKKHKLIISIKLSTSELRSLIVSHSKRTSKSNCFPYRSSTRVSRFYELKRARSSSFST